MSSHAGMAMKEIAAPDKLPPPVRMDSIGNSHISIKSKPEAKLWFDQGLHPLHDFRDYESARAFEQSVRLDPKCAMCYWGLYQALIFRHGEMTPYSTDALASAVRLHKQADKPGRLYIQAASAADQARRNDAHDGQRRSSRAVNF